jgi:glycerate kinase
VRVVVAPEAFGDGLDADAAAAAIVAGWHRVAPGDVLVPDPAELPGADLLVTGLAVLDWQVLRDSPLTALAAAAARQGVPCVVLAGRVLAGRRELAAIGVDAAHALDGPADAASVAALAGRVATRWSR